MYVCNTDVQCSSQIVTTNIPTPNVWQAGCPSCHPTNSVEALKGDVSDRVMEQEMVCMSACDKHEQSSLLICTKQWFHVCVCVRTQSNQVGLRSHWPVTMYLACSQHIIPGAAAPRPHAVSAPTVNSRSTTRRRLSVAVSHTETCDSRWPPPLSASCQPAPTVTNTHIHTQLLFNKTISHSQHRFSHAHPTDLFASSSTTFADYVKICFLQKSLFNIL